MTATVIKGSMFVSLLLKTKQEFLTFFCLHLVHENLLRKTVQLIAAKFRDIQIGPNWAEWNFIFYKSNEV